jgi:Type I restriction enzyme R protein N terminus (HSDR_N)
MEVINFGNTPTRQYRPDILFTNKNEEIVLLVEVKAQNRRIELNRKSAIYQLKIYLQNIEPDIRFSMLVDLDEINIFVLNNDQEMENLSSLRTNDILSKYNSDTPPGSNELEKIGLLPLLEGGHTYIQENLGADTLH